MFRKVVGMFIIGLLFATMIPVGSSAFRTTDEQTFSKDISSSASQLVITIITIAIILVWGQSI